jgi:hypothetical protein
VLTAKATAHLPLTIRNSLPPERPKPLVKNSRFYTAKQWLRDKKALR